MQVVGEKCTCVNEDAKGTTKSKTTAARKSAARGRRRRVDGEPRWKFFSSHHRRSKLQFLKGRRRRKLRCSPESQSESNFERGLIIIGPLGNVYFVLILLQWDSNQIFSLQSDILCLSSSTSPTQLNRIIFFNWGNLNGKLENFAATILEFMDVIS